MNLIIITIIFCLLTGLYGKASLGGQSAALVSTISHPLANFPILDLFTPTDKIEKTERIEADGIEGSLLTDYRHINLDFLSLFTELVEETLGKIPVAYRTRNQKTKQLLTLEYAHDFLDLHIRYFSNLGEFDTPESFLVVLLFPQSNSDNVDKFRVALGKEKSISPTEYHELDQEFFSGFDHDETHNVIDPIKNKTMLQHLRPDHAVEGEVDSSKQVVEPLYYLLNYEDLLKLLNFLNKFQDLDIGKQRLSYDKEKNINSNY